MKRREEEAENSEKNQRTGLIAVNEILFSVQRNKQVNVYFVHKRISNEESSVKKREE